MHLEQQEVRTNRKGKEKDNIQPTDIDEKLMALRRRTAASTRPRDRSERDRMQVPQTASSLSKSPKLPSAATASRHPPSSPRRHQATVSRPSKEADHEEFSRKLQISTSPSPRHAQLNHKASPKLFNPDTDPIPSRWTADPESMSDATGSSSAPPPPAAASSRRDDRGNAARQLFDHRKDDPVRFSVLARPHQLSAHGRPIPTPKSSIDHVSASSASSYAASISSSTFTLSSTTDGSSASSALFEGRPNQGQGTEDSGNNVFSLQLKKLYRALTNLETKIKQEDSDDNDEVVGSRVLLKGKEVESADADKEKWKKQIFDHKELAEVIHNLLEISLSPLVPASLRNIPTKYNIIVRLWTYGFHKLLEALRRASFTSPLALEHLQDFIYYAYTFYTGLLEDPKLNAFKSGWLEALGDLARYRMAVAAMVNGGIGGQGGLTKKAVSEADEAHNAEEEVNGKASDKRSSNGSVKSMSDFPAARIDDSPSPSIGVVVARTMDLEPEKERWRQIARDWYGAGLADQPGTGKLHHHLGLLSREVEGEELRGVYHFVKSMTTLHPFSTSRESILPLWSQAAQARRSTADARASELFVLLHGMLFTNIQLDDFQPSLARFIERLENEGAEEREWIMMAVINIASVLEYGRQSGVLRRVGCFGAKEGPQVAAAMRVMAKKAAAGVPHHHHRGGLDEEHMDVDDDDRPAIPSADSADAYSELPASFKYAMQLTFAMLSYVLKKPTRKSSQYAGATINPYLTVLLTFLATVLKHKPSLEVMERNIPWSDLANFFPTIPRKIMISQGLMPPPDRAAHSSNRHSSSSMSSSSSADGPTPTGAERWVMLTSGCPPPLAEDWCMRGMEWVGRKVFERGYWKSGEDRKAELEVLQTTEGGDEEVTDGTIEDDDGEDDTDGRRRKLGSGAGSSSSLLSSSTSASASAAGSSDLVRRWVRIVRSAVNVAGVVDGFTWVEGTREWKVGGKLAEKVARWKEEDRIDREEEERRRMGKRWADDLMDVDEDEDSGFDDSEEDENDSEDIKVLKARRKYLKSLVANLDRPRSPPPQRAPRGSKKSADSRPALPIVPGYTNLVIDTNILLSSLPMISSLIESQRWTVVIPLPVIMELDGLSSNMASSQLAEAAQAAMAYISSHIRTHAMSLKVQTSKGNYLTTLSVRTEEVDFDGGSFDRCMDDLILKAAIWQDDHWVDRSAMLKAGPPTALEMQNGTKVVLLSLDRNLRLKARSRQLAAASEKDLAAILAMAT